MKTLFFFFFVAMSTILSAQISITDTLFFNSNSSTPINQFNGNNNCVIGIEGYASVDGSSSSNQILSENRVNSVFNSISTVGANLSPEINVVGLGETSEFGNNLSDNRIVLVISSVACLQSYDRTGTYDWSNKDVNIVENTSDDTISDTSSNSSTIDDSNTISDNSVDTTSDNDNASNVEINANRGNYSFDVNNDSINNIVDSFAQTIDTFSAGNVADSIVNVDELFENVDSVEMNVAMSSPCVDCINMAAQWQSKFVYDLTAWRMNKNDYSLRKEVAKSYKAWEHFNTRARYCMSKKAYKQYHKSIMKGKSDKDNKPVIESPTIDLESNKDFNQFKYTSTSNKTKSGKSYAQANKGRRIKVKGAKGMNAFDWFLVNTGLSCR